ncbi:MULTISPECIES: LacI family DNA-binding transcriptional regulator [Vagococcus]|uniref:Ribose operon repressor n=1 Tax=Vagococcus fluvialis bH819 TaxID=1255619 RepID=A0A1X6WL75_9ENTE|nr:MULTISPECIES: LacI family DNA-binding transcriptional regulator [Vagococcus]SLM85009.1 Ribose operon repressor [Vagococcus fluvialis bH819]HCM88575.1 LacI family DNA-binding transcriptional regulator [Vagococcus sp.]
MANIHDIAKKSGYSAATVSRVLNQRNHVSKEAQEKIKAAIKELDYVPSEIARDLSRGKTLNIGIVLPHTKHPFFTEILRGAIDASFQTDYHLVILPSAYDKERELAYLEQLRSNAYDGLIFTSRGLALETLVSYTKYAPIVCCEDPGEVEISAVYSQRNIAYEAGMNWLKEKEYQKIGFFFSREARVSATSRETVKAYQKVYGQELADQWIKTGIATYEEGYQAAKEWHESGVEIEAIFSNGDDVAAGARQFYLDYKLSVPFLVGQEMQLSSQLLNISTIDNRFSEIGKKAFELVLDSSRVEKIGIPSKFVVREENKS